MNEVTLRPQLAALIDDVAAIEDPVERFHATRALVEELRAAQTPVKQLGQGAAQELKDGGRKLREVSDLLGISASRVDQILKGR